MSQDKSIVIPDIPSVPTEPASLMRAYRFTPREFEMMQECASDAGMTITDFLRFMIRTYHAQKVEPKVKAKYAAANPKAKK